MKDKIVLEFNQVDLDEYIKDYFRRNPRSRKVPIESPMVRSLNKMLVITNRIVQNNHKQNWKDYAQYIARKYGYEKLGISSADLNIHLIFPTKVRHDLDNYVSKEVLDGLSECGMIIDDSYYYIHSIKTTGEYQKGVTKMIFTFNNCKYDKEELEEVMKKEKIKRQKREDAMKKNKSKKKK